MGGGGYARELNAAGNRIGDLMASGKWDDLSWKEKDKLLAAADKESSKLTENMKPYSNDEWEAIVAYQGSGSIHMNNHALGKTSGDRKFDAEIAKLNKDLDSALGKRKLTKDIVVWRGSDTKESTSGRFKSVSLKAKDANEFNIGNHLHAYRIPKGTKYFYSNRGGEHEVILPRNFDLSKYKIK